MIYVLAGKKKSPEELGDYKKDPKLRRATQNMALCKSLCEEVLEPYADQLDKIKTRIGLFLGSGNGELEVTKEYFKDFAVKDMARPFLFQNSLHHSTLGFITAKMGFTGPSLTVSQGPYSGEAAIEVAMSFLELGEINHCLVFGVDCVVPEFQEAMKNIYSQPFDLKEGGAVLFLSNKVGLEELNGVKPLIAISDLNFWNVAEGAGAEKKSFRYDSDAVEQIIDNLENKKPSICLQKPDGQSSTISFENV